MTRQTLLGFGIVFVVAAVAVTGLMMSNTNTTDNQNILVDEETIAGVEAAVASQEPAAGTEAGNGAEVAATITAGADVTTASTPVDYKNPEAVEAHVMKVRTLGNPDADVKIEEFASLTCSHCAHFHTGAFKEIKENFIDTDKIHFVFTDFPLNAPALEASIVARCLPENRYFKFLSFLFETQDKWAFDQDYSQKIRQNAKLVGATDVMLDACLDNPKIRAAIVARMQDAGKTYEVQSTPSFVINNGEEKMSGAQPYPVFKELIEKHLADGENQ